jgi:dolichyl-phosphate-mannose--protein O-mannosyl transferase
MQQVSDYPRQRESRRLQTVFVMGPFVLLLGIACSFGVAGLARILILVITVAIVLFFVISIVRPVRPRILTEVTGPSGC